ncbi:MAG: hypothetical protein ACPG4T_18335 [Nannocystaceae bacterium]
MKVQIYTLLFVGLAGCSIVDNKRAEFEEAENSEAESSTDPTTDGEESGRPVPTTGGSTDAGSGSVGDTDEETTGAPPSEPPVIHEFEVTAEVDEAGPLQVDAEISGAVEVDLVISRGGEELDTIHDPAFPWELPITSDSFDGEYTFELRAWSTEGVEASTTAASVVDLPEGGSKQAGWFDTGELPSSAAAIVPVRAGNIAGSDGVLAALGIGGELWLYRFDTDLQVKAPIHAWCGDGPCMWEPSGMVVDTQNPDHVYVVGNGADGARLMKFDVNGQPKWPEAVELANGHASGVAYEAEFDRVFVSGWAEYSEDNQEWSNSKMWIVQGGEAVAQMEYESSYVWEGVPTRAKNRAFGITIIETGRVLLVGETQIAGFNIQETIRRGNVIEFDNFALDEKFRIPTWGDESAQSSFQGVVSDTSGGVVAAGWYQGDGSPRVGYFISFNDQLQPEGQHSSPSEPEGVFNAGAMHPAGHLIVAGVQEPAASAVAPTLWDSPYVSGAFSRAWDITTDRYGRVFLVGEKSVNGQLRATVEMLRP